MVALAKAFQFNWAKSCTAEEDVGWSMKPCSRRQELSSACEMFTCHIEYTFNEACLLVTLRMTFSERYLRQFVMKNMMAVAA
jgi:hypothetical protein